MGIMGEMCAEMQVESVNWKKVEECKDLVALNCIL